MQLVLSLIPSMILYLNNIFSVKFSLETKLLVNCLKKLNYRKLKVKH